MHWLRNYYREHAKLLAKRGVIPPGWDKRRRK